MLRYATIIPAELFEIEPNWRTFKTLLPNWIKVHIFKDGDYIFHGKTKPPQKEDWLYKELEAWKEMENHDALSLQEQDKL